MVSSRPVSVNGTDLRDPNKGVSNLGGTVLVERSLEDHSNL